MNILSSTFNQAIWEAERKNKKRAPIRHLTSFGTVLGDDNMIVEKQNDQEEAFTTIASAGVVTAIVTPPSAPVPMDLNKVGMFLILRARFPGEKIDKKTLFKRKDDFVKDMNFDLLNGKITKGTYYFDDDAPTANIVASQGSESVSLDASFK